MTDSVTDELEKLQQEGDTNNIGEVDGVNALLGDLDDDDELLGKFCMNIYFLLLYGIYINFTHFCM